MTLDISLVPLDDLPVQSILYYQACPTPVATSYLQAMCYKEGTLIDRRCIEDLYKRTKGDIVDKDDENDVDDQASPNGDRDYQRQGRKEDLYNQETPGGSLHRRIFNFRRQDDYEAYRNTVEEVDEYDDGCGNVAMGSVGDIGDVEAIDEWSTELTGRQRASADLRRSIHSLQLWTSNTGSSATAIGPSTVKNATKQMYGDTNTSADVGLPQPINSIRLGQEEYENTGEQGDSVAQGDWQLTMGDADLILDDWNRMFETGLGENAVGAMPTIRTKDEWSRELEMMDGHADLISFADSHLIGKGVNSTWVSACDR